MAGVLVRVHHHFEVVRFVLSVGRNSINCMIRGVGVWGVSTFEAGLAASGRFSCLDFAGKHSSSISISILRYPLFLEMELIYIARLLVPCNLQIM